MFVVLNVVKPPDGRIKRFGIKRKIRGASARSYRAENGTPFFILDVYEGKNGIDWKTTREKCGGYASRIIAPRGLVFPADGSAKRFVPVLMTPLLIFNTALEIIKKTGLPPEDLSITLTDRNALLASKICETLEFAARVRVVCSKPERYAAARFRALAEYGASLAIRPLYEPTRKPDVVVCSDGFIAPAMKNAAVFTSQRRTGGKIRFSGSGTRLKPEHEKILPPNIEASDFAGALSELCGGSEYRNAVFSDLNISCSVCGNRTPEKCLECYCLGGAPPERF